MGYTQDPIRKLTASISSASPLNTLAVDHLVLPFQLQFYVRKPSLMLDFTAPNVCQIHITFSIAALLYLAAKTTNPNLRSLLTNPNSVFAANFFLSFAEHQMRPTANLSSSHQMARDSIMQLTVDKTPSLLISLHSSTPASKSPSPLPIFPFTSKTNSNAQS